MLELIMLCEMYLNFESVDKIPKWIKPKLEREIAHGETPHPMPPN